MTETSNAQGLKSDWLVDPGECFAGLAALAQELDARGSLTDGEVRSILRAHLPPSVVRQAEPAVGHRPSAPSPQALAGAMLGVSAYLAGEDASLGADRRAPAGHLVGIADYLWQRFWGCRATPDTPEPQPEPPQRRPSWLYALRNGYIVKLGRSATPSVRLRDLNIVLAGRGKLLALVSEAVVSEREAHERWASLRVTGEWFRATPELLEWLAALGLDDAAP